MLRDFKFGDNKSHSILFYSYWKPNHISKLIYLFVVYNSLFTNGQ